MAGAVTTETGPSAVRRVITTLVLAVALFAAVVVQLTVVNRLPWPGAAAPDLVLLLVAAIAVGTGPTAGAVSGFCGGLALDTAPPAAHYAGEYALVFCLVGYCAAKVVRLLWDTTGERGPLTSFTVMAVAAAAGEAGKAALGLLLSEPDVTAAAVAKVLPAAILYDLLLAPFAYAAVAWVTRGIRTFGRPAGQATAPGFSYAQRLGHVFRPAAAGAAPDLRLAGTGANYHRPPAPRRVPWLPLAGTGANFHQPAALRRVPRLRLAGTGTSHLRSAPPRRVPKLRLAGSTSPAIARTGAAARGGAAGAVSGARTPRLSFAGDLAARTRAGHGAGGRAPRTPGRNWLGGPGRRARVPHGRGPGVSGASALAARSAPSGISALSGPASPLARRSPQAGWLRGSSAANWSGSASRALAPRRGWLAPRRRWLGAQGRPRTVIGSGARGSSVAFRRGSLPRGNWYTAAPSRAWLRRSRHPWRQRRQRLLRMMGVGR